MRLPHIEHTLHTVRIPRIELIHHIGTATRHITTIQRIMFIRPMAPIRVIRLTQRMLPM